MSSRTDQLLILSAEDVRRALPIDACIAAMRSAFGQLSAGRVKMPLRLAIDVPQQEGTLLLMPAYARESGDLALKVASIFPHNLRRQRPIVAATVLLFDVDSGQLRAVIEGSTLTALRTAAGAALSADLLARPDAATVALLGSGVQARAAIPALCAVRPIEQIRIYSPNEAHRQSLAADLTGDVAVAAVDTAAAAVRDADIVYCATTSNTPVFADSDLKPGAHVISVGSYTPEMQEVPAATVVRALVVVDEMEAALAEAGDLIKPISDGLIEQRHIYAEIGELINGNKPARSNDQQITFFKSVGVAVQDAVAAAFTVQNALKHNIGQKVSL